jgi:hypothetical protein
MTPLCKVGVTLPGVRRASGVRGAGGIDEQEGIRPARGLAGRSVWPSACRGRLRVTHSLKRRQVFRLLAGLKTAARQLGLEASRPAEQ